MAYSLQAKKRVKQNLRNKKRNRSRNSEIKTCIKRFLNLLKNKVKIDISSEYRFLISKIDKCVKFKLYHKNKANRLKKRLELMVKYT